MTRRDSSGRALAALAVLLVTLFAAGCVDPSTGSPPTQEACRPETPEQLSVDVLRTLEHDSAAYTQGLVVHEGRLYESTGLVGSSTLRELDPDTGAVLRSRDLDPEVFGEGLAVGREGRLVQLTWKDGIAYEWDAATFDQLGSFSYEGEGWGLTTVDDGTLVMSDGSDTLVERNPEDFEETARYRVAREGGVADLLNELEWDGEHLWANRYLTDEVLRIDRECGVVTGVLDIDELADDAAAARGPGDPVPEVSNGIAHVPGTDRYLLTGKRWPTMYEVTIRVAE